MVMGGIFEGFYQNQYLQSFSIAFNYSNGFLGAIVSGRFPVRADFCTVRSTKCETFSICISHVFFLNFVPDKSTS